MGVQHFSHSFTVKPKVIQSIYWQTDSFAGKSMHYLSTKAFTGKPMHLPVKQYIGIPVHLLVKQCICWQTYTFTSKIAFTSKQMHYW